MLASTSVLISSAPASQAAQYANMEALKGKDYGKAPMKFEDYESTEDGLQYKDLREGTGAVPKDGDVCVIDWQGYTIGYYGRIFESRNKVRNGRSADAIHMPLTAEVQSRRHRELTCSNDRAAGAVHCACQVDNNEGNV